MAWWRNLLLHSDMLRGRIDAFHPLAQSLLAASVCRFAQPGVSINVASQSLQEICCCMGQPVGGNPTQYMMEKAFAREGLEWRYLTLEVSAERLADAMRGFRAMGFRGGNFTIPHKVAVIEHLDDLSEAARLMGAVNCVNRQGDQLFGENTDGKGFVQALQTTIDPAGKKIVILGAGGAGRAIAVELGLRKADHITIVNRSAERGQALVDLLNDQVQVPATLVPLEADYEVPEDAELLINTTSIGMGDPASRVPLVVESLRPELVVADVTFNPPETRLIRDAKQRGCSTVDGLGMLVHQAVISFKLWTGVEPDAGTMRDALEEFLGL